MSQTLEKGVELMNFIYVSVSIISLLFSWRYTDLEKKIHNVNSNYGFNVLLTDDSGIICSKIDRLYDKKQTNDPHFKYTISLDKGWKHRKMSIHSSYPADINCFRDESDPDSYYFSIQYSRDLILNDTLTVKMHNNKVSGNCLLLKTDDKLNIQLVKNLTDNILEIRDMKIDHDGNYVFLGYNYDFLGDYYVKAFEDSEIILLKMTSDFQQIWEQKFDSNTNDINLTCLIDNNGNIYTSYTVYRESSKEYLYGRETSKTKKISRFDQDGNLEWEKSYPVVSNINSQFIMGPDSLLYVFSAHESSYTGNLHLAKIDLEGNKIFERKIITERITNLSLVDIDIYGKMYLSFHSGFMYGSIGDKNFTSEDEEYWEACYSENFEFIESRQKFLRLHYYLPLPTKYRGTKVFNIFKKYNKFNIFRKKSRKGYVKIYTADVPIFFDTKDKRIRE